MVVIVVKGTSKEDRKRKRKEKRDKLRRIEKIK
jgi:hypothetical protein